MSEGNLCCFQALAIIYKAFFKAVCAGFCVHLNFQLIWINIKGMIVESYDSNITFSFIRKYQTIFQSGDAILHSHQALPLLITEGTLPFR